MAVRRRNRAPESLALRGHLVLTVLGPDGEVRDRRAGDNVICTNGYSALAAALVWAGLQDQAANLGLTAPTYLTPLYGAVGTGAGVPAKTDTALSAEYARTTVGAGAASPATGTIPAEATWLYYFASPASPVTITEAGIFAGATSAAGSGTMVDHWAFSPSVTVPVTDSLILQVSLALGP